MGAPYKIATYKSYYIFYQIDWYINDISALCSEGTNIFTCFYHFYWEKHVDLPMMF